MDLRTVMLMLAVGSYSFGILLFLFKFSLNKPQFVPYWIEAKLLQGAGSLLMYFRTDSADIINIIANIALLMGCAYEAWAVRILSGLTVRRRLHVLTSVVITAICSAVFFLPDPFRSGSYFVMHGILYLLPGIFVLRTRDRRFSLRRLLGVSYTVTSAVFFVTSLTCFIFPEFALTVGRQTYFATVPVTSFCIFLFSGFILLMLAKERSDIQVYRFQRIVETANEGVVIFDEDYNIVYLNENMAKMFGYTIDEMMGMHALALFPEDRIELFKQQEALRRQGKDSVYECTLLMKSGDTRWFLISAKSILNDSGEFEGSFAIMTDINDRKVNELQLVESNRLLTELASVDSLTGIANRRIFDDTLEREYKRLCKTGSMMSIIIIDIDHFKEYNDFYGHIKGDECLKQIGNTIAGCIRRGDLAARYGGEEFVCILPDANLEAAVKTAERIRQRIAELNIEHKNSKVMGFVTVSLGVACMRCTPDRSPSEVVAAADEQLYKAKLARNTVEYEKE